MYADAPFKNVGNGISQIGFIGLINDENKCSLIKKSKIAKRVTINVKYTGVST